MLTWLVLFVLAGFMIQLNGRLRRIESRLDEAVLDWAPEPQFAEPSTAWPEPEPALASEPTGAEPIPTSAPEAAQVEPAYDEAAQEDETEAPGRRFGISFEELFGRRLPIWAGGITLAVAGMLIVKLSIESGLITPPIRVLAGLLFGAVLIAGAELALRYEERVRDARVRQALAGAGVASLYASVLVAANLYRLIDPVTAMLGMAGTTALALFLSTRFGPPSALLGLAGGLAAPALVGSAEPNVPLLSLYLALAVAGLCTLSRNQRWAWLGISALVGGFGWGLLLLLGGALDAPSSISLGLYLLLLGVGIPALGFAGDRRSQLQLIAGIAAAAQMAVLVATGGFALLNWALFAMLSLASLWLARRDAALVRLPAVGLLIVLLLLGAWPAPSSGEFALVLIAFVLIYGAPAAWRLWRPQGQLIEAAEIAALGLGALLLPMFHFHQPDGSNDLIFGLLGLGLSFVIGAAAAAGWRHPDRGNDTRFALLASAAALLLAAAALLLLPIWIAGVGIAATGLLMLHLGQAAADPRLEPVAWIFAAAGVLPYPYAQIADGVSYPQPLDALHWALLAGIAGLFAWRARLRAGRNVAQFLVPPFLFIALSLLVSSRVEPLIPAALLLGVAAAARGLDERLSPAMISSALLTSLSALPALFLWSVGGIASLAGSPMLLSDVPEAETAITNALIPGVFVAAAVAVALAQLRSPERIIGLVLAGALVLVGAHSLYKQVFAIDSTEAFVALGLAERTLWELALVASAAVAARLAGSRAALVLAAAAAGHLAIYTLLLHNPLWAEQAVGRWPLLNLLLPVYALAIGLTMAAQRWLTHSDEARRGLNIVQMALVTLFAFSTLRQLFHGAVLVEPGLPVAEDILRSILAIALAICFLLWGIARSDRDWRIASLALMLAAVAKVFLLDASGLEGVTRIASFVALGLSLIGIGWLYSRFLSADRSIAAA
jgi:uncharacterized membrane protein